MAFDWTLDRTKYLDRREVRMLRKAAARPSALAAGHQAKSRFREWFLVELGLEAGLRVREMAGLRCGDLVLVRGAPAVRVTNGKGGKARTVDVSESFAAECRVFLAWKKRHGESVQPDAFLLIGKDGGSASRRALQRAFKRVAARAGLPGYYSIHCLRHTYGTLLYEVSGCDIRFVQQQLGHSRVSTTEVYAHVAQRRGRRSVNRLSRMYRG